MNVILVHGFYDAQDLRLIQGIQDQVWYAKPRGANDFPLPHIYTLDQWDLNDDYEDFVNWMCRRIHFDYGDVIVVTPNRDQKFVYPTVQLKHPARIAHILDLGITVHL